MSFLEKKVTKEVLKRALPIKIKSVILNLQYGLKRKRGLYHLKKRRYYNN